MRFSLLATCTLALFGLVHAGTDQDIEAAKQKFCSGLSVTGPSQGQQFSDPTQVQVTVQRQPDSESKVINGVDIYTVGSDGQPKYLGTPWKGNYALNQQASLTVDITKTQGVQLPSQFEFRVWVHNQAGPDCTLMSKVFRVASSEHTNEASFAMSQLDDNIDRGCFGIAMDKPELGRHADPSKVLVQIKRDPMSHVQSYKSLELHEVNLDTREPQLIQQSWSGDESADGIFNYKDSLKNKTAQNNAAYYYKLTGVTQDQEECEFYSHAFYLN